MSEERKKNLAVHLRVYRPVAGASNPTELLTNAEGKITNENQLVKFQYDTPSWHGYLRQIPVLGFAKVTVEKVFKSENGQYAELTDEEILSEISAEVEKHSKPAAPALTPEQKRIAELEAKIEGLLKGGSEATAPKKTGRKRGPKTVTPDHPATQS